VADFDSDGDLDIVTGNPSDNFMYFVKNIGNDTFATPVGIVHRYL